MLGLCKRRSEKETFYIIEHFGDENSKEEYHLRRLYMPATVHAQVERYRSTCGVPSGLELMVRAMPYPELCPRRREAKFELFKMRSR